MTTLTLTGYLGRDREIRDTREKSYTVTHFNQVAECDEERDVTIPTREYAVLSLATHENRKGGRRTTWHRCVAWNLDRMDKMSVRLARKGDKVRIKGRRETSRFTGRDGQEREIEQVVIEHLTFLKKKARQHP